MDDLIRRQDAIKAVESLPNCYNGFSDTYDKACFIGLLEEVPATSTCDFWDSESNYCALYRPSAQPEQRWIPVTERLPERGVSVLISHVGYVSEDYLDIDNGALFFWNSGLDLDEERQNIAWMPLPKPWGGEANDRDVGAAF